MESISSTADFREDCNDVMQKDLQEDWPEQFAAIMQKTIEDVEGGQRNASNLTKVAMRPITF